MYLLLSEQNLIPIIILVINDCTHWELKLQEKNRSSEKKKKGKLEAKIRGDQRSLSTSVFVNCLTNKQGEQNERLVASCHSSEFSGKLYRFIPAMNVDDEKRRSV